MEPSGTDFRHDASERYAKSYWPQKPHYEMRHAQPKGLWRLMPLVFKIEEVNREMKDALSKHLKEKEVKNMKKILVVMTALALLLAMGSMALAKQDPAGGPGNIVPNEVAPVGHAGAVKDYRYWEEGARRHLPGI
ncbi:MAG: hypothetical protein Q8J63_05290 [Candidatus Aquicultor sp.]|nr:hypothetical protein [Candidatus Aquicultor sp.]